MREAAAVTTPMCWSFKRWTMRDVHSPVEDWDDEDEGDDEDGDGSYSSWQ